MSALEELFYSKVLLQSAARFAGYYHVDLLYMFEADRNVLKCKVYVQEEDCPRYNNEERDGVRRIFSTGGVLLQGFAWFSGCLGDLFPMLEERLLPYGVVGIEDEPFPNAQKGS